MLPKSKELFLIKEDLKKHKIYNRRFKRKKTKNKSAWGRLEFENKRKNI